MTAAISIPHVIHYCWFGGSPLGDKEQACIESWRKFLPDYEIKRWDESNWNVHCCDYVSEAYAAGKWAFVSDYARFDILWREGGLYFDTDVELVRPIDDILERGPFMGFETDWSPDDGCGTVAPGLGLAAGAGHPFYKAVLDSYCGDHFITSNGDLNETTIVQRTTEILLAQGLKSEPGIQEVDGIWIYPSEYFNPKNFFTGQLHLTENTRSIHHFSMSWLSEESKYEHEVGKWLLNHRIEKGIASKMAAIATILRYQDWSRISRKLTSLAKRE